MSPSILRFIVSFEVPVLQGDQSRYWHFPFGCSITMTRSQNRPKKREASPPASQLVGKLSFTAAHWRSDGRLSALFWEIAVHVGNHKWIILDVQVCTANTSGRISKKSHRKPD